MQARGNFFLGRKGMSDACEKIVLYGTNWCYDSKRARSLLDQNHIAYQFIDIDVDMEGRKFVEQTNRGYRSVPTIVFPDGSILVEPSNYDLTKKLGLS
jgi:mycoredoxin